MTIDGVLSSQLVRLLDWDDAHTDDPHQPTLPHRERTQRL